MYRKGDDLLELDEAISIVLRKHRKMSKLSQEQLAHESGLDRTYISFLERGLRKPTIHTIFRLCGSLGINPSIFIREVEKLIENSTDTGINR
jgi:transcriptional regulator with XRE-family HTH domain